MAISKIVSAGITADFDNTLTTADLAPNSVDSSELVDGSIDTSHIADNQVTLAKLSATGTASSSTFLRGDNSWQTAGSTSASDLDSGTLAPARMAAGSVVKQSFAGVENQGSHLQTSSTSFVNILTFTHVTALSSTDSYLLWEFFASTVAYRTNASGISVTMSASDLGSYSDAESLMDNDNKVYNYGNATNGAGFWRLFCGLETGMGMPATKSSWASGDTLKFQMWIKMASGSFYLVNEESTWNCTITEIAR